MEKLNTQKVRDFVQSKNSAMVTTAIAVTAGLSSYTAFAANPLATALQTILFFITYCSKSNRTYLWWFMFPYIIFQPQSTKKRNVV